MRNKTLKNVFFSLLLTPIMVTLTMMETAMAETIWIDVRTPQEYASGHLSQAHNIPHRQIGQMISLITEDKDSEIKLYCAAGVRAERARQTLKSLGFTNVTNEGGYDQVRHFDESSSKGSSK